MENIKELIFELDDWGVRFGFAVETLRLLSDGLSASYEEQAGEALETLVRLLSGMHGEITGLVDRMLAAQ